MKAILFIGFLFVIGAIGVTVGIAVILGLSVARLLEFKSVRTQQTHSQLRAYGSFVTELPWMLIPFAVLGSFVIAAGPQPFLTALSEGWFRSDKEPQTAQPSSPLLAEATDGVEVNPVSMVSDNKQLPEWCRKERTVDGDIMRLVLTSRLYSTQAEAESELAAKAVRVLSQDLKQIQSGLARPYTWKPSDEQLLTHAVRKRFEQVSEHDFGSFKHPMHRVWWEVELSPAVRSEFLESWRAATASFRIVIVAVSASALSLVASLMAMFLRIGSRRGYAVGRASNSTT